MFKDTFIIWKMRKHFMMITSQGQGGEGWPRGLLPPPVESVRAAGTAYRNLFTSVLLVLLPGIFLRCYLQTERGGGNVEPGGGKRQQRAMLGCAASHTSKSEKGRD